MLTLLDGRKVSPDQISFDPVTQRFAIGNEDITWQVRFADKQKFSGFDSAKTNQLAYEKKFREEHGGQEPPQTGSTSTLGIFTQQILNEPLKAPLEAVDSAVKQVFDSSGVKTVLTIAAVGLIVFLGYKASKV